MALLRGIGHNCVVRTIWLCLLAFGVAISAAALAYPGDTWERPYSAGFSFWHNFWCDLLATVALNGEPNVLGAVLARVAFACFALALLRFWPLAATLAGREQGSVSVRLGSVGAACLILVSCVPAASSQLVHGAAVVLSAACSLAAVAPLIPSLWARGAAAAATLGSAAIALAVACVLQYVYQGVRGEAAPWLAGLQKIATTALLAFMLQVLSQTRIRAAEGASTLRSAPEVD